MDNKRKFNDYYYGMAKKSKKDEDPESDDEKSLASILKGISYFKRSGCKALMVSIAFFFTSVYCDD